MYFEIENTPEHIRRRRDVEKLQKRSPKEEFPRLVLAPFTRQPQVIFQNVLIGTSCVRNLEVFNPSKQVQQITLGKSLPPGLEIHLPGEWLILQPETCYCLTMQWTPRQPTALRESIRFTNENRGRYDVIVVLKSVLHSKLKNQPKAFKISPGKTKKKTSKKSPVAIYKKKSEIIYNSTKIRKTVNIVESYQQKVLQPSSRDNIFNDYSLESRNKCPFDSPTSVDFTFDTSEIFSNMRKTNKNIFQQTYEKSFNKENVTQSEYSKPPNKHIYNTSNADIFDDLTFTPLKSAPSQLDKLDKGPKIILSVNSDSDFDDSLDKNTNKENETHSIVSITSTQSNKWLTINQRNPAIETTIHNKNIPNTSSPKELNSPNFSINTEFSRISDLSFLPHRFSTEKKGLPKLNNDTHDIIDDIHMNAQPCSDTYTKESPIMDQHFYTESNPSHFFLRDQQPKICRQALFREYQQQREVYDNRYSLDNNVWPNDLRNLKSPPRSITPPLQSIPEESTQFAENLVLDNTDNQMTTFTISDRTFNKDGYSISKNNRQSWSKKAIIKTEPDLWKVPVIMPKKFLKPKSSVKSKINQSSRDSCNRTFESNKSFNHHASVSQIGNVYSQSSTIDPFLASTYFYDEETVDKFEKEFKRWLNCMLTPPADLDSNTEVKIDVGKAWIENRNKDVPAAPTKEQVSSNYHNSRRLETVRRAARALLMSSEIVHVIQKVHVQIDKKLIAIRHDRNLHLDVGLQRIIMELLLSYNPLWLRIGLEAIYGLVLPLKSNSDIDGLTTFIIQRMFKNPNMKNKHSKSNAPNMLLPAYMEAIKKFTLKKFFMLVFFLDQAKQKKLITHDPCLFCRNASCKESREIVIRFTRELISGIGDITKHLRPLGYIVNHKQSYLDEYKYAVHNLAIDIRDGVRLTKVMEIILMKNGLMNQLRTPAISRLQKIHNVGVALTALKETNFVIVGDITANDIADGHREKTLSLLWQIIHSFRAPLFENAANVIQTWWRKKYEVIVEKRREKERILKKRINSACTIQSWWRRIQYNRLVEWQMQQVTVATIILQKYWRMWVCRARLRILKKSVRTIEEWYRSVKMMKEARVILIKLKLEKEELQRKSEIQSTPSDVARKIKKYTKIRQAYVIVQRLQETLKYIKMRHACVVVQRRYRAYIIARKQRMEYCTLKCAVITIQKRFKLVRETRKIRAQYEKLRCTVLYIQRRFRANKISRECQRNEAAKKIQSWCRAVQKRNACRAEFVKLKTCAVIIQSTFRMFILRRKYTAFKNAVTTIQRFYRCHQLTVQTRQKYVYVRSSIIKLQSYVKGYVARKRYAKLFKAVLTIQTAYRLKMRRDLERSRREKAAICIQNNIKRYIVRSRYLEYRHKVILIQKLWRGKLTTRLQRWEFLQQRQTVIKLQAFIRGYLVRRQVQNKKQSLQKIREEKRDLERSRRKKAAICIQNNIKRYIVRSRYLEYRHKVILIQKLWRGKLTTKLQRLEFLQQRLTVIKLQAFIRGYLVRRQVQNKKQSLQKIREEKRDLERSRREKAAICIQNNIKRYIVRSRYLEYRHKVILIQKLWRGKLTTKLQRLEFLQQRQTVIKLQAFIRGYLVRRQVQNKKQSLQKIREEKRNLERTRREKAAICIQNNIKRYIVRSRYLEYRHKVILIQKLWRGKLTTRLQRWEFLQQRQTVIKLQAFIRGYLVRRQVQNKQQSLQKIREEKRHNWAASKIQALYRGYKVRANTAADRRIAEWRQRWREGAFQSTQQSMKERNEIAMDVLFNMSDIETVIRAFRSLELLTEVFPMLYHNNAHAIVRSVYIYMSVTNRSISSIELLKSAASILVNFTRYKVTGPKIYSRDFITPTLKFMWRFSNSEMQLFCILSTYLWLFAKYDKVREDLTEFLHVPENHKMLVTIKCNVDRMKRMTNNVKNKHWTPQPSKFVSRTGNHSLNYSVRSNSSNSSILLPTLEPDYGIMRADKPRYFDNAHHAIGCLFNVYKL